MVLTYFDKYTLLQKYYKSEDFVGSDISFHDSGPFGHAKVYFY